MKKTVRCIAWICLAVCLFSVFCACSTEEAPSFSPTLHDLTWAVNTPLPEAAAFADPLPEGCSLRYAEQYSFSSLQAYSLELIFTDEWGRESRHEVSLTLVVDSEPPTVSGLRDREVILGGGGVSYLSGVTATDNCDGRVKLEVNTSGVNLKKVGTYPVIYTATDAAGNTAEFYMTLSVVEKEVSEELLNEKIDLVIRDIISSQMRKQQKLRTVYDYVYDHVAYTATSNKSSWVAAAYEGLTTGQGDCYTYFALSKAFFERLGIENMDIERKQSAVVASGERHFWNFVNLGTEEEPLWYHFDACHLNDIPKPWGFLMTDAQLQAYSAQRKSSNGLLDYFYAYDNTGYPASATEVITAID
ncbi:MAG: transglutaminase domain-containing protein [Clostridia bacterium]|nr:transglutaminase domain-containing protein [Clostridia bacterium]